MTFFTGPAHFHEDGYKPTRRRVTPPAPKPPEAEPVPIAEAAAPLLPPRPVRLKAAPTLKEIMWAVTVHTGVSHDELVSASRVTNIVRARWLVAWVARDMTSLSVLRISRALRKDHTTMLYGLGMVAKNYAEWAPTIQAVVDLVEGRE